MRRCLRRCGGLLGAIVVTLSGADLANCSEYPGAQRSSHEVFSDRLVAHLVDAACKGDVAQVRRDIDGGADPNAAGADDTTPLVWAVRCENTAGIGALLQARANPNHQGPHQRSPILVAASAKNPAVMKLLLKAGGDPNAQYELSGLSLLDEALSVGIHTGRWDNYYTVLNAGADINRPNGREDTIANSASYFGRWDKVAELMKRGYSHDLKGLALGVQMNGPTSAYQAPYLAEVKALLERKGISFPVK